MIKLKHLISETPIDHIGHIGDFSKGSSYTHKADRVMVSHPVQVAKIKNFFSKTSCDFDFYFVNTKDARKFSEQGRVNKEFIYDELKITPDQLKNGRINNDNITVFFTNNKGSERMPMTPWVIAHRFGHVIRKVDAWEHQFKPWLDGKLNEILSYYGIATVHQSINSNYELIKKFTTAKRHLCETIGTFKSARDKKLRDDGEFFYEIFAQYLNTGEVKLNPLPDALVVGHGGWGRKDYRTIRNREAANETLHDIQNDFRFYGDDVLGNCIGGIFVM